MQTGGSRIRSILENEQEPILQSIRSSKQQAWASEFFSGGGSSGIFQGEPKGFFPGWAKNGEISFFPLETKKRSFSC